jgi:hypothetical protein
MLTARAASLIGDAGSGRSARGRRQAGHGCNRPGGNRKPGAAVQMLRGGAHEMKTEKGFVIGLMAVALSTVNPGISATIPNSTGVPTQIVITVLPAHGGSRLENLGAGDVKVLQGKTPATVIDVKRLAGDSANMQLFVLLDDSTQSSSLGIHLPQLKAFLQALPPSTQVGVGYMRNGTVSMAQAFTADHEKAASALRLPEAIPGGNGSPYFALSDLVKHWPSKQSTDRRAVLMLTDGLDRYWGTAVTDDPYVDAAIHDALKESVMVYSIYLRGAGFHGQGGWTTNFAQSRLMDVSEETGGYAYFENFTDPVTISPFLKDFQDRLGNQYEVTIETLGEKGVQPVKVRTELPGVKIESPPRVFVR